MATNWELRMKRNKISLRLRTAIQDGKIERPETCELCGSTPGYVEVISSRGLVFHRTRIVAHHWRGYDYPFDVWFICHTCNMRLTGPEFHNGSVSKEEARKHVLNFQPKSYNQ